MDKGLHKAIDDLNVGEHYAVVGCKCHDNPIPIAGLAFKVTAINLPFLVGKLVMDPSHAPITLDLRYLNLMSVDESFVNAQMPSVPQGMVMVPESILAALRGK